MPSLDLTVSCPVHDSFRVQQVCGMFDVPLAEKSTEQFAVELPADDEPWQIGLIVGPSGSGKSTVARAAFGDHLYRAGDWPEDRAVVDGFFDVPTRQTVEALTAVGFSSPPSWIKPYHALSNGQQMRCDLARALASSASAKSGAPRLVVFDEFTSVVDRNVARACSAAVAKAIRGGRLSCRFVGVTCHYDVARWLEADWVLDMATGQLTRRRLRRPRVELEIYRCDMAAWQLFAHHHYLSGSLHRSASRYLGTWNGEPVAFCATLPLIGQRRHRRFTRIVTLPDFQGMGFGMRMVAAVAQLHREDGFRINVTSSHPALIRHCTRSPAWRVVSVRKVGTVRRGRGRFASYKNAASRATVSFEYVGAPTESDARDDSTSLTSNH
ncbi:hypothetical protein OAS39_06240 [Pirellulales bacterium]|nr:hypothetical protein [Pirellulales bacterium]